MKMMTATSQVYITDKTGVKRFKTLCATAYAGSEIRNLERKLEQARQNPQAYSFLDLETSVVKCEDYKGA